MLSRAAADRSFSTKYGVKTFWRGYEVSCYVCHNGVNSSDPSTRTPPVVADAKLAVAPAQSGSLSLAASGTNPVLRIVRQPAHGTVALSGRVATYFPDSGFAGPDNFLYAASDNGGYVDSTTAATVSVSVGGDLGALDSDGDGIPDLLEYATGLSPQFPSPPGTLVPVLESFGADSYLSVTIPRFLPPSDVTVSIEVSPDLVNWQPATTLTNTSSLLKARDSVPLGGAPRRFMRMRAVQP